VDQQVQRDQQAELEQLDRQAFVELLVRQAQLVQQARHQLFKDQLVQQVRRERQSMFAEALQR
jgi:hypothetical protein